MLEILRKRAQSTVIQAVVLVIAIVFVFWGVGTNMDSRRTSLATVNGEEIPYDAFQRSYDNAVDNMRTQFGGSIPEGFLEGLGLNMQVLNQLVQGEILRQGGIKMGLTVSKLATQEEIKSMAAFQANGQFDLNLYRSILEQNRMNPTSFEAGLQDDLLARLVSKSVQEFAVVSDGQIDARYRYMREQIRLAYSALKSEDFEDKVEVNDQDLAAWYDKHKNDYLPEPKIKLQYLIFSADDDLDEVQVSDEVLKARYDAEKDKYFQPEQRRARHILLRVSENDNESVRAEKKKKADEVLAKAQGGADFAELAKTYSEDSSAQNGGDLGFFSKGTMVESFDKAVFQMKPEEISGLVETVFGYHIIKLEEVREATSQTFDQVKDELADQIRGQDAKKLTFKKASQAYENIFKAGSLAKYKEAHPGDVLETEFFSRNEPPDAPVSDPRFLQAAFSLKKGELSSIVETGPGYAILYVNDVQAPVAPELQEVREQVVAAYRREKSVDLAKAEAESLLKEARAKKELAAAAPKELTVHQSGLIIRDDQASAGDVPAQVVQQAFARTLKDALPEEPLALGTTYYVFQLLERTTEDKTQNEDERNKLREQLLAAAKSELMNDWLAWMQGKADIWVNEEILK